MISHLSLMVAASSIRQMPIRGTAKGASFDWFAMLCYFCFDSTRHASIERCAHPCGSFYFSHPSQRRIQNAIS